MLKDNCAKYEVLRLLIRRFLYNRNDLVKVVANLTYLDSNDVFEREPYIVHFSIPTAGEIP